MCTRDFRVHYLVACGNNPAHCFADPDYPPISLCSSDDSDPSCCISGTHLGDFEHYCRSISVAHPKGLSRHRQLAPKAHSTWATSGHAMHSRMTEGALLGTLHIGVYKSLADCALYFFQELQVI